MQNEIEAVLLKQLRQLSEYLVIGCRCRSWWRNDAKLLAIMAGDGTREMARNLP